MLHYILGILNDMLQLEPTINIYLFGEYIDAVNSVLNTIKAFTKRISALTNESIHDSNFPEERKKDIDLLLKNEKTLQKTLYPLESKFKILELEKTISKSSSIKDLESNAKEILSNISKKEKEAIKVTDYLKDVVTIKGLDESAAHFDKLRQNHSKMSFRWFITFIVFSVLTAGAIGYVIAFWKFDSHGKIDTALLIFQRILILSAPSIFLKISLTKYQLERNLRIIYDHRATVLEQYKTFENAIGDDAPAKNEFRLAIAKYIFSDPLTGYITQSKNNEVAINPIINMVEKAANKANIS